MHKGVIYFTKKDMNHKGKNLEHMIGEELLRQGLLQEYGKDLEFEPRGKGEHGKPFFTLEPQIHYNITHSGEYVACILADQAVGLDIQEHTHLNMKSMLRLIVPEQMIREILEAPEPERAFFTQWVLREAYIKWTGEGLSRDLRTIPMDEGISLILDLEEGYSGAVWSEKPMEISWVYKKVDLLDSSGSPII